MPGIKALLLHSLEVDRYREQPFLALLSFEATFA